MLRPVVSELGFLPHGEPGAPARQREVTATAPVDRSRLLSAISDARDALLAMQRPDGHWSFVLEADCTISAEYILMMHFMDEVDEPLQSKIACYLREHQEPQGGWTLYPGGDVDLSCSVKCYFALKLAGDDPHASHMARARVAILAREGAARSNVFTRIALAMFGQIPWRGVPFIPVEIMLLPRWFPFHLSKVSYWSRTVLVPLTILCSLKAQARNPRRVSVRELFTTPPELETDYFTTRSLLNRIILVIERAARLLEPAIPARIRQHALTAAENWVIERLNGSDGLGGIFPAMVNAYEALALRGYDADHPYRRATATALRSLIVVGERTAFCQPCVSPVWDTALACLALQEAGDAAAACAAQRGLRWLQQRQIIDRPGDWQENRPHVEAGGWPFQYRNDHYPDLDDTPVVAWAMVRSGDRRYQQSIARAARWICGMQSRNGGFAAFDADNTHYYLNEIPFADHGALLDPPISDVTARCVMLLASIGLSDYRPVIDDALRFLAKEQESAGPWFGRWGTNYIYGTWAVLAAMEVVGAAETRVDVQRAVDWLKQAQREDGGWGEDNDSYLYPERAGAGRASTAFQTAWAVLALIAAGEDAAPEVRRGIEYLLQTQQRDGVWHDAAFTAPGFPRVFYLKYHGYDKYFPLWALARYYNIRHQRSP